MSQSSWVAQKPPLVSQLECASAARYSRTPVVVSSAPSWSRVVVLLAAAVVSFFGGLLLVAVTR